VPARLIDFSETLVSVSLVGSGGRVGDRSNEGRPISLMALVCSVEAPRLKGIAAEGVGQRAAAMARAPRRRLLEGERRMVESGNAVSAHQRTFSGSIPVSTAARRIA
jgi:hypothetical protein